MGKVNDVCQIRPSKELLDIINYIRAKYYLHNKRPPSIKKITEVIAKRTSKEKLYHENFFIEL